MLITPAAEAQSASFSGQFLLRAAGDRPGKITRRDPPKKSPPIIASSRVVQLCGVASNSTAHRNSWAAITASGFRIWRARAKIANLPNGDRHALTIPPDSMHLRCGSTTPSSFIHPERLQKSHYVNDPSRRTLSSGRVNRERGLFFFRICRSRREQRSVRHPKPPGNWITPSKMEMEVSDPSVEGPAWASPSEEVPGPPRMPQPPPIGFFWKPHSKCHALFLYVNWANSGCARSSWATIRLNMETQEPLFTLCNISLGLSV